MRLKLEHTVRECQEPGRLHANKAILILEWPFDQQKLLRVTGRRPLW